VSFTERALQSVLYYLEQELDNTINANNSPYANTPTPNAYLFGAPDLRRASAMPIVAIDLDREELATRTLGGVNISRRQKSIPAVVYIYHAHRDEETLLRQIIRLVDAVVQTLEGAPQSADYLIQYPRLVDLSPAVEGAGQPYLRVAAISLQIIVSHRQGESA